jgi:Protein of unknown function (DUF4230)
MAQQGQNRPQNTEGGNGGVSFIQKFILFALLCTAGYLLYQAFGGQSVVENAIPRAMHVTYVPSDFKMQLDNQKTLEILSNPQRYKNEFDKLISDFNTNLVVHVATRMGLTASQKSAAVSEYRKMHPSIRQMYFNDFISLGDTTNQAYQSWYENESANAVDLLNEVASKYTCFFITNIIATILKTQDGKLAVGGKAIETPCGIALTEGVRPLVKRLQETAAVRDFSRAHNLMKERVERAITELAVMEVRDKKGIKVQNSSKLLGYSVSTTELEIVAMSIMKVGFNLQSYFNISVDDKSKSIIVTLPQPQILSHEVYPKIENLDIGLMRDLTSQDINDNVNKLRQAFREDANKSDIFDKSQVRAQEVMKMILEPMVRNINKSYKITVRFRNAQSLDNDLPTQYSTPRVKQQPKVKTQQPLKR